MHEEAYDLLLKKYLFTQVVCAYNSLAALHVKKLLATSCVPGLLRFNKKSSSCNTVIAFRHYHLRITFSEKDLDLNHNKENTVLMLVGTGRLEDLCHRIAGCKEPIRRGGPLLRDLPIDVQLVQSTMERGFWKEECLLTPFVGHHVTGVRLTGSEISSIGSWWDFPNASFHNVVDPALRHGAQHFVRDQMWASVEHLIRFMHCRLRQIQHAWKDGTKLAEAAEIAQELVHIVKLVDVSQQAALFRANPDCSLPFRHAMDFFSIVSQLTACGIALTAAEAYIKHKLSSDETDVLLDRAIRFAHGAFSTTFAITDPTPAILQLGGTALLYLTRAYTLKKDEALVSTYEVLARARLKENYDTTWQWACTGAIIIDTPKALLEFAGVTASYGV